MITFVFRLYEKYLMEELLFSYESGFIKGGLGRGVNFFI